MAEKHGSEASDAMSCQIRAGEDALGHLVSELHGRLTKVMGAIEEYERGPASPQG